MISPNSPVFTTDGLKMDPTRWAWCCSFHLDSIPDPSFLVPSSSSIVSMSVPRCLVAAEAKVMETKGGLGINSALTSSFRILSHAKRWAARRAEGDADNYSRTLSHRRRLTLQTDWQMKRAEIASIKKTATCQNRGDHLQYLVSNGKRKEKWACMGNWAHNSTLYKGHLGYMHRIPSGISEALKPKFNGTSR